LILPLPNLNEAWLPILHTSRKERHYTALFSNTARAHELRKTHDWVVLFCDDGTRENRYMVMTSEFGPLSGRRIVPGRDAECKKHYEQLKASELCETLT
jgi:putative hydrolase